jgi:hypothetical protein
MFAKAQRPSPAYSSALTRCPASVGNRLDRGGPPLPSGRQDTIVVISGDKERYLEHLVAADTNTMTDTSPSEIQAPRADPRRRATPMRRMGNRRARRRPGGRRSVAADPV